MIEKSGQLPKLGQDVLLDERSRPVYGIPNAFVPDVFRKGFVKDWVNGEVNAFYLYCSANFGLAGQQPENYVFIIHGAGNVYPVSQRGFSCDPKLNVATLDGCHTGDKGAVLVPIAERLEEAKVSRFRKAPAVIWLYRLDKRDELSGRALQLGRVRVSEVLGCAAYGETNSLLLTPGGRVAERPSHVVKGGSKMMDRLGKQEAVVWGEGLDILKGQTEPFFSVYLVANRVRIVFGEFAKARIKMFGNFASTRDFPLNEIKCGWHEAGTYV